MSELGKGDWSGALAEVEQAVGDCLAALGRYEDAFADVLGEAQPSLEFRRPILEAESDWSERTAAARAGVSDLERLLHEQEQAWASWQESYRAWRRSLEQLPR